MNQTGVVPRQGNRETVFTFKDKFRLEQFHDLIYQEYGKIEDRGNSLVWVLTPEEITEMERINGEPVDAIIKGYQDKAKEMNNTDQWSFKGASHMNKISSMLDTVANSLESKGLIKEAYEIDKMADKVEKLVDSAYAREPIPYGLSSLSGPYPFGGMSITQQRAWNDDEPRRRYIDKVESSSLPAFTNISAYKIIDALDKAGVDVSNVTNIANKLLDIKQNINGMDKVALMKLLSELDRGVKSVLEHYKNPGRNMLGVKLEFEKFNRAIEAAIKDLNDILIKYPEFTKKNIHPSIYVMNDRKKDLYDKGDIFGRPYLYASMLDAVANSLEAKGLIKEAYEIDKVADEIDLDIAPKPDDRFVCTNKACGHTDKYKNIGYPAMCPKCKKPMYNDEGTPG